MKAERTELTEQQLADRWEVSVRTIKNYIVAGMKASNPKNGKRIILLEDAIAFKFRKTDVAITTTEDEENEFQKGYK